MATEYNSFEEIRYDLKRLSLQRKIAFEELKGIKSDVQDDFSIDNWIQTALGAVKKFGILYLVRKIFK